MNQGALCSTFQVTFDVDVEHPVVAPAALTGLAYGIDRRSAGPVAIRVGVEHRLQTRLQVAWGDLLGDTVGDRRECPTGACHLSAP